MQIVGLELLALIIAKFVFRVPVHAGGADPLFTFIMIYVLSSLLGFVGMAGLWLSMQGFGVLLRRRIVGPFADWILFDPTGAMGNVYFFLMSVSFAVLWVLMSHGR